MSEDFRVTVNSCGPDRPLFLRWTDPNTGRRLKKSAGTHDRREAERLAGVLEKELREGKYAPPSQLPWEDFTWRYCEEALPALSASTAGKVHTVFNAVERILSPRRLIDLTASRLSYLATQLRAQGVAEATIRSYLAHLHAALEWAAGIGLLAQVPKFPKTKKRKGQKVMKGRPITEEEFERMLGKVPEVLAGEDDRPAPKKTAKRKRREQPKREVNPAAVASWLYYLRGLWWSGLRLRESLVLSWDRRAGLSVDISGEFPMLRIRGDAQKSGRDQLYPVAPEFGEILLAIPEDRRRGRVFRLLGARDKVLTDPQYVSAVVVRMGEAAGIKVDERAKRDRKTGKLVEVVKFASAHDLRRSFGFRWSRRVLPAELRELMRHADIQTTMQFYVGQEAQTTAASLWAAYRKAKRGAPWTPEPVGPGSGPAGQAPADGDHSVDATSL